MDGTTTSVALTGVTNPWLNCSALLCMVEFSARSLDVLMRAMELKVFPKPMSSANMPLAGSAGRSRRSAAVTAWRYLKQSARYANAGQLATYTSAPFSSVADLQYLNASLSLPLSRSDMKPRASFWCLINQISPPSVIVLTKTYLRSEVVRRETSRSEWPVSKSGSSSSTRLQPCCAAICSPADRPCASPASQTSISGKSSNAHT
jgi:hypothetical protein